MYIIILYIPKRHSDNFFPFIEMTYNRRNNAGKTTEKFDFFIVLTMLPSPPLLLTPQISAVRPHSLLAGCLSVLAAFLDI